jgi:hypothetical protein
MTGGSLLLSRSRSASYCPDVATKNAHLRPTLIVDDHVPKCSPDPEPWLDRPKVSALGRGVF